MPCHAMSLAKSEDRSMGKTYCTWQILDESRGGGEGRGRGR